MSEKDKFSIWIKIISIAIPVIVALLFRVKIDYTLPIFLPPIYATINGITAFLLIIALISIKSGKITLHKNLMKTCIGFSLIFLLMYIAYHITSDPTIYGDINRDGVRDNIEENKVGYSSWLYLTILFSHILLSIILIPLVLISYVRTIQKEFSAHKKIARITFPIWFYVTISGVFIYFMISPYY